MTELRVIVTGGFGVLGQVVAQSFANAGNNVARLDFSTTPPSSSCNALDIGGIDLSDTGATAEAVDKVAKAFNGIDVLVNVAGGFAWRSIEDSETDLWQHLYKMNVLTGVTIIKAALPMIKASAAGRIVNIGAFGALRADAGMGAYAASKSGVHRMTEALATELAGTRVTVNAILPSVIDTPVNRTEMPDADFSKWVSPKAIADVILFLASPQARSISGALIPVSRGTPD